MALILAFDGPIDRPAEPATRRSRLWVYDLRAIWYGAVIAPARRAGSVRRPIPMSVPANDPRLPSRVGNPVSRSAVPTPARRTRGRRVAPVAVAAALVVASAIHAGLLGWLGRSPSDRAGADALPVEVRWVSTRPDAAESLVRAADEATGAVPVEGPRTAPAGSARALRSGASPAASEAPGSSREAAASGQAGADHASDAAESGEAAVADTPVATGVAGSVAEGVAGSRDSTFTGQSGAEAGGHASSDGLAGVPQARGPEAGPGGAGAGAVAAAGLTEDVVAAQAPALTAPVSLPVGGRRAYDVFLGDYTEGRRIAAMHYVFEHDGVHYSLRSEGRATGLTAWLYSGLLVQSSSGRVGPAGLLPERYVERRGEKSPRSVVFDREAGIARGDDGRTQALAPGVQDQLSVLWQLGLLARGTPDRLAPGRELRWPIARGRRVETMRIVSIGEDVLHPAGSDPVRALHLAMFDMPAAGDGRFDVWLSRDDTMLPVRMRLRSPQGLVLDQMLRISG